MKKKYFILLLGILVIFSIFGCRDKFMVEQEDVEDHTNPTELTETQSLGDGSYDLEELKERLLEAQTIELKGIEGEPIGALQNREVVLNWVENLFNYPIQENYPENSANEVVGPLNFYFSGEDDIYGIVKKDYINVEGYYFLITNKQLESIQNLFKSNVLEKPISGN